MSHSALCFQEVGRSSCGSFFWNYSLISLVSLLSAGQEMAGNSSFLTQMRYVMSDLGVLRWEWVRENAGIVILGAQISSSALLLAARYDTAFLRLCLWQNTKCVHFLEQTDVCISSWYVVGPTLCLVSGYVHLRGLERCFHSDCFPSLHPRVLSKWLVYERGDHSSGRQENVSPSWSRKDAS